MKPVMITTSLLLVLGLAGCGAAGTSSASSSPMAEPDSQPASQPDTGSGISSGTSESIPAPADTALYRGTVQSITEVEGGTELVLTQAEGTNFGSATQRVLLQADTSANFEVSELVVGDYLEVYYGAAVSGQVPQVVVAVVANLLPAAEASVLNGTIKELMLTSASEGKLLLTALADGEDVWVSYDENTQAYLYVDNLQVGDKLSVLTNGLMAQSYPPMTYARELRYYSE